MSLPPRERLARFAATSLVPRAGHRGLRVPLAAVVAPHASSQLAAVREVRSCCSPREVSPRPRCEPAPPLASRRFAACSMLPCARRSSPLAPASGSRGWRPSHRVALRRRAHSDGDGDDATVTEVNGGAQLSAAIT